jgi:hypothetical protein
MNHYFNLSLYLLIFSPNLPLIFICRSATNAIQSAQPHSPKIVIGLPKVILSKQIIFSQNNFRVMKALKLEPDEP